MRKLLLNVSAFVLMMLVFTTTWAQEAAIKGQVKDVKGDGLPGVSVVVKGTNRGTTTDGLGNFLITANRNACGVVCGFH